MNNAALDQLVQDFEGCDIAAFADFDVGIPLRTAGGLKVGQEALNALCARGKTVFAALPSIASASRYAFEAKGEHVQLFMRAPDDPDIGLIAQIDTNVPLEAFLARAQSCMGDA